MGERDEAYRRWLFCYPRQYRRVRGEEIIGTMLDAAPPGRAKPTSAERWDLVRCGLRARLGRPASLVVVVFAAMLTVLGAVLGGEAAAWTSWQAAPAFPSNGALVSTVREALATSALGQPHADGRDDQVIGYNQAQGHSFLGGGEEYGFGTAQVYAHTDGHPDYLRQTRIVHDRMRTLGWAVSDVVPADPVNGDTSMFTARRGRLLVEVDTSKSTSPGQTYFVFSPARPWWTLPATILGFLLGGLAGWVFAGWLSRRTEGRSVLLQALVLLVAGGATVLQLPAVLLASTGPFGLWTWWRALGTYQGGVAPGWSYAYEFTRPVALLGLVLGLVACGLAALPRIGATRSERPHRECRLSQPMGSRCAMTRRARLEPHAADAANWRANLSATRSAMYVLT